ncbi:hypothetical protein [Burkholderia pseudomallei]|nr:hypothetical protein [Burkholderia pseudomallei]
MRASLNSLQTVSLLRYVLEGSAWAAAYGAAAGFLWYGAYVAGPYLRSLG